MPSTRKQRKNQDATEEEPSTSALVKIIASQQAALAQQQSVLQKIASQLATQPPASGPATTAPAPPAPTTLPVDRSIQLPKLAAPEELTIPSFRDWKQRWTDFANSRQLSQQSLDTQQGILRSSLHPEWTILWSSERLNINANSTINGIITELEGYLRRQRNPILDRLEFLRRDQQQGESVDRYYATLRMLDDACFHEDEFQCVSCNATCATSCTACSTDFPLQKHLQEVRIRDRLICGLLNKEMQRRVLAEQCTSALTLERVLSICVAMETSNAVGAKLSAIPDAPEINAAISKKSAYKKSKDFQHQPHNTPKEDKCWWCAQFPRHSRQSCPAADVTCDHCGIQGHFTKLCFKKQQEERQQHGRPSTPPPTTTMKNNTVLLNATAQQLLPLTTTINGSACQIKWLPDTGSEVNAISHKDFLKLGPQATSALSPYKIDVVGAISISLGPIGTFPATLQHYGRTYSATVGVFQHVSTPLLSLSGCKALGLVPENWPNYQPAILEARATSIQQASPSSSGSGPYIIPQRKGNSKPETEASSNQLFQQGTTIIAQNPRTRRWNQTATIVEAHLSSYLLQTKDGRLLRRHGRLLRPYHPPGKPTEDAGIQAPRPSSKNRRPPISFAHSVQLSQGYNSEGGHEVCLNTPHHPDAASPSGNASDRWPPANAKAPPHPHATQKKK